MIVNDYGVIVTEVGVAMQGSIFSFSLKMELRPTSVALEVVATNW